MSTMEDEEQQTVIQRQEIIHYKCTRDMLDVLERSSKGNTAPYGGNWDKIKLTVTARCGLVMKCDRPFSVLAPVLWNLDGFNTSSMSPLQFMGEHFLYGTNAYVTLDSEESWQVQMNGNQNLRSFDTIHAGDRVFAVPCPRFKDDEYDGWKEVLKQNKWNPLDKDSKKMTPMSGHQVIFGFVSEKSLRKILNSSFSVTAKDFKELQSEFELNNRYLIWSDYHRLVWIFETIMRLWMMSSAKSGSFDMKRLASLFEADDKEYTDEVANGNVDPEHKWIRDHYLEYQMYKTIAEGIFQRWYGGIATNNAGENENLYAYR